MAAIPGTAKAEEPVYFANAILKDCVEDALGIPDPTPTNMLGLGALSCTNKGIVDLTGLEYATNLKQLDLGGNQISDISSLAGLTNLKQLWMDDNQISDISAVAGLTNLTWLNLYDNQISDISALAGLTNLRYLYLYDNQTSDISALAGLTKLERLGLYDNQISDISAVAGLTNLEYLFLDINQISNISALYGLTKLERLGLASNQISDISVLLRLTNLTWLQLRDNPLNPGACDYYIPLICENNPGIFVYYDPCIAVQHTLTISSTAGGYVNHPGEGTFQYDHGTGVSIVATAIYHFVNWTGTAVDAGKVVDPSAARTTVNVDADYTLQANFEVISTPTITTYVDDDAPNDPGPNDPAISDPNENGSSEHPFDMIQKGIDAALDGETVIVRDGTYREAIEFAGRNITVTAFDPNEPNAILLYTVIDANYIGTAVTFCHEEEPNCILEGFVITRGAGNVAGGINCVGSSPTISHCLIVGNRVMDPNGGGAVFCIESNAVFENCTFSGNYGGEQGAGLYLCDSNAVLLNCIVWDNLPYQIAVACGLDPNITFSDVQDTWPGQGNIDIDPCFAELGYWADEPFDPNAVWVGGDYHLKSQAGRWEPYSASWLIDDVTSLCIDAGGPNSDWTAELWPHGKRINMGAYGGTQQASMYLSTVGHPLSEALDTALSFTTGGSVDWFGQSTMSHYDGDAAQSGDISDEQESWMQTTVSGKGTVKFYWKVSSEDDFDFLEFYIDGALQEKISGSVSWQQKTYTISTSGSHVLEWRYMKDGSHGRGSDCGWVDMVEWVTSP
jgi:hypothetical protein